MEEGGLGFKTFLAMIETFEIKLLVRLRAGDSLWADFMHLPYSHPMLADGSKGSCTWRRICVVSEKVEQH